MVAPLKIYCSSELVSGKHFQQSIEQLMSLTYIFIMRLTVCRKVREEDRLNYFNAALNFSLESS
jgi:hypothetical protein